MLSNAKINIDSLRKIIKEEISQLNEQIDHAGIRDVVTGASKLLAAIETFKGAAPHSAINSVTPQIDQLEKILEDMISTPGSYVSKPKQEPKKVTLKPVKQ